MKRTLFLLALVAGLAMAEDEAVEVKEEGRGGLGLLGPIGVLIEIGLQIVILIALISFISTLKASTGDVFGSLLGKFGGGGDDYGYYPAPAYEASGGSSYVSTGAAPSGYYKRSVDTPSIMDLPSVQRLTARIHEAIDNFNY